ncbi:2-hydroxyacid dehydrogenase [Erwinia sorbitola]|uniref:2-hydroxyacid dehydrogenase n=1 Tax=Erwinia sorbitola TaxID=2681984 RepID=A0A6I6ERE3_9GAMM|nr:2-hydroxyacid dehydrogenase [Erwinia sorbitola]QGU87112.1 2-hydroxyacid dehydrogenase [Erwinia sorbitola]
MKQEILIIQPLMPDLSEILHQQYHCHRLYEQTDVALFLSQHGHKIRAVATRGDVGLAAELMAALPALELITVFGVGTDAIDLAAARDRNITVTITSDILTDDVADLALALMLSTSRQIVAQDTFLRSGAWQQRPPQLGNKLSGKRVGIMGLGKIGAAIARRCAGFDMQIGYCNSRQSDEPGWQRFGDLHQLAQFSDFLVLAVPGDARNRKMVDAEILSALGEQGILINVARGAVVNEDDLIEALQTQRIRGAGLDVFDSEPGIDSRFASLNNTVLTPHIASATAETRQAMAQNVVDNLAGWFKGEGAITPIG